MDVQVRLNKPMQISALNYRNFSHLLCRFLFALSLAGLPIWISGQTTKLIEQRNFRFDDIISQEELSDFTFSADGATLAFVRSRPFKELPQAAHSSLGLFPREDIWLQDSGQAARQITNGEKDISKWWDPKWSPDGSRLSFLSTRRGNVTLWLWERSTKKVRQVSDQGVRWLRLRRPNTQNYLWLDNHHIIFLTPLQGKIVRPVDLDKDVHIQNIEKAQRAAGSGGVSVSVVKGDEFVYPKISVFVLDVETGKGKRIATTIERDLTRIPAYFPSPDGRFLVVSSPVTYQYNVLTSRRMGFPSLLELRSTDGESVSLDKPLPQNIHTRTLKWSPDGRELAFFANGPGAINPALLYGAEAAEVMPAEEWKLPMDNPAKLYRVNIENRTIVQVSTGDIDLGYLATPDFMWNSAGELIFYAPKRRYGQTAGREPERGVPWGYSSNSQGLTIGPQPPKEWVVLSRDGITRPLLKDKRVIQEQPWSINGGRNLVTVSDGVVLNINANTGEVGNLTDRLGSRVARFIRTDFAPDESIPEQLMTPNSFPPQVEKLLVMKEGKSSVDTYSFLDITSGNVRQVLRRSPNDRIVTFEPGTGNLVYVASSENGAAYWRATPDGKRDPEITINAFWRDVKRGKTLGFEYLSLDGRKRSGSLKVPPDFNSNRRYPLVVEVYPRFSPDNAGSGIPLSSFRAIEDSSPLDLLDLRPLPRIGMGFLSLSLSLPTDLPGRVTTPDGRDSEEGPSCPYMINAVVPAIDKLIELGAVDPSRVFLEGGSMGGWATLCIIGHTPRFQAAVASSNGTLGDYERNALKEWFYDRYSDNTADFAVPAQYYLAKSSVPWWRDGDRMQRNNPITYADRIQTPLLLIDSDFDFALFEISEKFFNALVSMRKPAEFARYWGEGHGLLTPANYRDSIMRRFAWYDRWGDIARDEHGNLIWEGDRVKGRNGAPPLKPEDYEKFDLFQPSPARKTPAATTQTQH